MISRPLAVGLLAVGCLSAAAAGSFVAGRQSAASVVVPSDFAAPQPAPAQPAQPVTETEGVVEPRPAPSGFAAPPPAPAPIEVAPPPVRQAPAVRRQAPAVARTVPARPERTVEAPRQVVDRGAETQARPAAAPIAAETVPAREPDVEYARREAAPTSPRFEELVIPSSSVIGLEIETAVSSETARVEDRVDARVTRDVYADGRVAIPSGARVIGAVTHVERGGKIKERARLGIRFHTLVLGDGRQVDLRTETIYREGESVSAESSKKIGAGAIGGAVLGAIMGGGKGALLGSAAGAAGGTAVVMAGGRNPATVPSGTAVTARVSTPVSIEVERRN